jgi:hypothetical protein
MHAILGARKPAVAARLLERRPDGTVRVQALMEKAGTGPAANGAGKAERVAHALKRIFLLGAKGLAPDEWSSLFALRPPVPDNRWSLLVRLATEPEGDEGKLRDLFAALPDGTAFSMRLLLLSRQGGARAVARKEETASCLPFNRLPDVARLVALSKVKQQLNPADPKEPKDLAVLMEREVRNLGLPVKGVTGRDVTDRLFNKIRDNGGGDFLPPVADTGRGRKSRPAPVATKEPQND